MSKRDPRVDAYIAKAAPFAKPILDHLRAVVHGAAPGISETIKWGMPFFEHEGTVCHMAAFQAHCAFGFWKGKLLFESGKENEAMGQFGRIATLDDLPPARTIAGWVKKAVALNEKGVRVERTGRAKKEAIAMPDDFGRALKKSAAARATWEGFPPSHRREYLEWITEAKTAATRARRLATALEWLAEGKSRMWKYQKPKVAAKPAAKRKK
ncbi:MAG: YdeI family protein [Thermoanaerobaculia bacterium]